MRPRRTHVSVCVRWELFLFCEKKKGDGVILSLKFDFRGSSEKNFKWVVKNKSTPHFVYGKFLKLFTDTFFSFFFNVKSFNLKIISWKNYRIKRVRLGREWVFLALRFFVGNLRRERFKKKNCKNKNPFFCQKIFILKEAEPIVSLQKRSSPVSTYFLKDSFFKTIFTIL